ncbi:MAG: Brp/Blh family beta-carotene 15,15'-dioxygenase [Treponemataceae bacterium]|nr:Brp/Blh family beta-carotene 15,15'-dioxygenase [Treponemataceae bacterium]
MKKRQILIGLSIIFLFSHVYAADWVVAASKFEVEAPSSASVSETETLDNLASQIPSLILGFIPQGIYRTVHPEEVFERDLYVVRKNKQSQFDALHTARVNRDSLIFSYSSFELDKKKKESENSMKSILEKISDYEQEEKELVEQFNKERKRKKNTIEKVAIYKNDNTKLYEAKNGVFSLKDIDSALIRGLIRGKIIYNNGFLKVECTLTHYPQNVLLSTQVEIGAIGESEIIAKSLMNSLLPSIINDQLVNIDLLVFPKEAGDRSTIFIEDMVYHGSAISATFTSGKHTIRVESPDYDTCYFNMEYEAGKDKIITINMTKKSDSELYFVPAETDKNPEIFLNTVAYGHSPLIARVSDKTVLGESINSKGDSSYFILKNGISMEYNSDYDPSQKQMALVHIASPKENLEKRIDRSRKRMYWSYGGLILTVPIYYYFRGMSDLVEVSEAMTGVSQTSVFALGETISGYVLIGAGVNFLTQLIIYLVDANRVIPKVIESEPVNEQQVDELRKENDFAVKELPEGEEPAPDSPAPPAPDETGEEEIDMSEYSQEEQEAALKQMQEMQELLKKMSSEENADKQ